MEDFASLRLIAKKAVHMAFRQAWQFKLVIPQTPPDFDLFVKDISYGPTTVETAPEKYGISTHTITWPIGSGPVELAMTMRDHEDGRIKAWFEELTNKILHKDGTVGLPSEYLLDVTRYTILRDGQEVLTDTWKMLPTNLGDVTESREDPGFCEFPITFVQFIS
jgi:hypothetical protein